jgi:hypothetical protein
MSARPSIWTRITNFLRRGPAGDGDPRDPRTAPRRDYAADAQRDAGMKGMSSGQFF